MLDDAGKRVAIALGAGVATGAAAGLVGVGGGEFRLPVLLYLFGSQLRTAAGVNLVVGLFTVVLSLLRRWPHQIWSSDDAVLAGVLVASSLAGAVAGARGAARLATPLLRKLVASYLFVVGVWMIVEAIARADRTFLEPEGLTRLLLAAVIGWTIAVASAAMGVAGGEMRIPALMYLFGVSIRSAGTISLLVSIPTLAAGALTYRRLGHVPNGALPVALAMATGSLAGVWLGVALLPQVDSHTLKAVLGGVLVLATLGIVRAGAALDTRA
jgi:uncharacterized membrane protein YfcA